MFRTTFFSVFLDRNDIGKPDINTLERVMVMMTTVLLILKGYQGVVGKKFKHQKWNTSPAPNFSGKSWGKLFFLIFFVIFFVIKNPIFLIKKDDFFYQIHQI